MESNKSVRNRSVDENYNIGMDEALTMMLSRVRQFAPALLSEKIMSDDGKSVLKTIFPMIRMDGFKMKKRKGRNEVVEALGEYGYFELKPEIVQ